MCYFISTTNRERDGERALRGCAKLNVSLNMKGVQMALRERKTAADGCVCVFVYLSDGLGTTQTI